MGSSVYREVQQTSMNAEGAGLLSEFDLHLFNEGTHVQLHEKLGAQPVAVNGTEGTHFAVWAPNAQRVFVAGDFNGWNNRTHPLGPLGQSGIWSGFIPHAGPGAAYRYHLISRHHGYELDRFDPLGFRQKNSRSRPR